MAIGNLNVGVAKVISTSTSIKASQGALLGIWVSAASATPTITIYDDAATGTSLPIASVFTPVAANFYSIPISFANGLYVVISGTVSCSVIYA